MELLFDNKKQIFVDMPAGAILRDLIFHLKDNVLQERPELFVQEDTVYICLLPIYLII